MRPDSIVPENRGKPAKGSQAIAIWFSIITLALALLLDYFLWRALGADPLVAWLSAINLMVLLTYFLDNMYCRAGYPTLPESIFLVQAITGGTLGVVLGMLLFNHAASRYIFRRYLVWILFAQVALVAIYVINF